MNQQRRKELNRAIDHVTNLKANISTLLTDLQEAMQIATDVKDEEQEAFDNLSEKAQEGDKGSAMQEAIENMESAIGELESLIDTLEAFDADDIVTKLDDAKGMEQ